MSDLAPDLCFAAPLPKDPAPTSKAAHLRYVHDAWPGIRREPAAEGAFRYFGTNGLEIADAETLA